MLFKIILSRMPVKYRFWGRIGLFRHGGMGNAGYAISVFLEHFSKVEFMRKNDGFIALELGPGDSVASAIIARAFGAERCYMVDAGAFASDNVASYRGVITSLRGQNIWVEDIKEQSDITELLDQYGGVYLTNGLDSLRSIPDESVDFIWSQAVLEHIPLREFDATMRELQRILRKNGVCSHQVDLKDHLGAALNNLRFSEEIWEAKWMAQSGFYTNRIRFSEMLDIFSEVGFDVEVVSKEQWQRLPTKKSKMQSEFRKMSDEDLSVAVFDVVLRLR